MHTAPRPQTSTHAQPAPLRAEPPRLDSRALLGNGREVLIAHNGEHYRLSLTRAGKLILTK